MPIILLDPHVVNFLLALYLQLLIDLILDRQAVAIPSESSRNKMACLRCEPADHILDGPSRDVPVMGGSGGEGRTVIEGEGRQVLSFLKLLLEGIDLGPISKDFLLFLREVDSLGS